MTKIEEFLSQWQDSRKGLINFKTLTGFSGQMAAKRAMLQSALVHETRHRGQLAVY